MEFIEIFDEIVNIMHNDYSGCNIKKGWDNPKLYRNKILKLQNDNKLDRKIFKEIVDDYLLDFKDSHVYFVDNSKSKNNFSLGFQVRRYEDKLYIIDTWDEKKLKKGDAITALDGILIYEVEEKYKKQLLGQPNERQLWGGILKNFNTCTVENLDGETFEYKIKKYPPKKSVSEYTCKKIESDIGLITANDFQDFNQMKELIDNSREMLSNVRYLIIDVRNNAGGFSTTFIPLLDYIFPENTQFVDDDKYLHNITERNYINRKRLIREYLKTASEDKIVKEYDEALDKYRNKGFVKIQYSCDKLNIKGSKLPQKVIVLIDRYCGSAGDGFAMTCAKSEKTILMGRPTYGVIDYSDVAQENFEEYDFSLSYATTVSERVKKGQGIDNVGFKPDIYIPWTPEHIKRDVDLEKAIELLRENN